MKSPFSGKTLRRWAIRKLIVNKVYIAYFIVFFKQEYVFYNLNFPNVFVVFVYLCNQPATSSRKKEDRVERRGQMKK